MALARRSLLTAEGEIWLWHEPAPQDDARPVVLWIDGAYAIERPRSFELQGLLPEAAVFNAHLPGNHAPATRDPSIAGYAAAFSEVLDQLGRPAIVVGASIAGLAAFALRSPWLRGVVALDPPLLSEKLWPLAAFLRSKAAQPDQQAFIWNVFGIASNRSAARDYRPLLEGLTVPAWVLFGSEALYPKRAFTEPPRLLDEPERALLAAHPKISIRLIEGIGHNVGGRAISYVRTSVRDLIARTLPAPVGQEGASQVEAN